MRAHYVIADAEGWRLYYSHWGALTIDRDLFWGPDHARRFITAQRLCHPLDWMDESLCEAAAVVDLDGRSLTLFGGCVDGDVIARRMYVRLLRHAWSGYRVSWAVEGLGTVADELEINRRLVRGNREPYPLPVNWESDRAPLDDVTTIATVSQHGAVAAYPSQVILADFADGGPESLLIAGPGGPAHVTEPPLGGLHVDAGSRTVSWWTALTVMELAERFRQAWPGWACVDLDDRFEAHVQAARGALFIDRPPTAEVRGGLVEHLMSDKSAMPNRDELLDRIPGEVTVSSWFDAHVHVLPSAGKRRRILSRAVAALGSVVD